MKNIKNNFLSILLIGYFLVSWDVMAQEEYPKCYINRHILFENEDPLVSEANDATITQKGNENMVFIQQIGNNKVMINQNGTSNLTDILQMGEGNALQLTQSGSTNNYEGIIQGNSFDINIDQKGSLNHVLQNISGGNLFYHFVQMGHLNEIIHEGDASIPLFITQHGSNLSIIIK